MPIDLKPYNKERQRHGYWEVYYLNGQLSFKGEYVNGKPHGPHIDYWSNGELLYKGMYDMGKEVGFWNEHGETVFYAN